MAVSIAEYLGQRVDSDTQIEPAQVPAITLSQVPTCPFNDLPCAKISQKTNPKPPVCALRIESKKYKNEFYIVCEHRLLSPKTSQLNDYQKEMLLGAAKVLFHPDIKPSQVGFRSEVPIRTSEKGTHDADFVLTVVDQGIQTFGPRRILVEVQGGGETSKTGNITRYIQEWVNKQGDNAFIGSKIGGARPIVSNAWRRFQDQFLAKATTANKTGHGFAALVGEVFFDYMERVIPDINALRLDKIQNWDVAFVVYKERSLRPNEHPHGAVELEIDTERTLYTKLDTLLERMIARGIDSPQSFMGSYKTLTGETIVI